MRNTTPDTRPAAESLSAGSSTRATTVSRRSYDLLDPAGQSAVPGDTGRDDPTDPARAWPVIGNHGTRPAADRHREVEFRDGCPGHPRRQPTAFAPRVEISLAGAGDAAELWTITVENLTAPSGR